MKLNILIYIAVNSERDFLGRVHVLYKKSSVNKRVSQL